MIDDSIDRIFNGVKVYVPFGAVAQLAEQRTFNPFRLLSVIVRWRPRCSYRCGYNATRIPPVSTFSARFHSIGYTLATLMRPFAGRGR